MVYPTIRLVFDRKKKASPTTPGMIEIIVCHERRRKYFSTGIAVLPSQWSEDGKIVGRADAFILNSHLEAAVRPIRDAVARIISRGEQFSISTFDTSLRRSKTDGSFIAYAEQKITERKDIRDSTRKTQMKLVKALREFKLIHTFSDLTKQNIRLFDNWLHGRYVNQCTIHSYHKYLKRYINMALEEDLITDSPYKGIKIDRGSAGERRFLSPSELEAVKAMNIDDSSVMKARDVFLFQCYTGLAYTDLANTDFKGIEPKDGKYILNARRQKTGTPYYIVLLSPAVQILERYRFRLPIISNQKYNMLLKAVAAHSGLKFNLTSHCGRHTYATLCLNNGIPLETLKEMMGHADIQTTAIYAKMLKGTIENAFSSLEGKF